MSNITLEKFKDNNGQVNFEIEGENHQLKVLFQDDEKIYFDFNGKKIESYYYFEKGKLFLDLNGESFNVKRFRFELNKSTGNEGDKMISPMPGKITKVFCYRRTRGKKWRNSGRHGSDENGALFKISERWYC